MERYQVVHSIGSGSFGHVSLGYDKTTNRKVALKRISKGNKEEQEIKSLRKEYEIQKDLHHPNIIQMLDSYETDDALVVVTELAHYDLSKLISKADWKTLPVPEIQKIACDLLSAIHFLHSRSILHRDIKPQNILIGYDKRAKLCDFGFARSVGIQSYLLTSMKGTPLYMAPEIVHGKPYDHNADLWSLGCILYELLMGRPPFFTTSLGELYKKVTIESIIWPEHISGDCLNILQHLLEKDPKKRLTWPDLLHHPFVCGKLNMLASDAQTGLTKALSPSQELAKEMERQALTRKLVAYNKQRERYQKKAEKAEKKLGIYSEDSKGGFKALFPVPANGPHIAKQATAMVPFKPSHVRLQQEAYHDVAAPRAKAAVHRNSKIQDDGNSHRKKADKRQQVKVKVQDDNCEESNTSSCETMTSSSDECETESEDGDDYDTKTVIQDKRLEPIPRESSSTESCFGKHETRYPQQPQQQVISVEIISSRNTKSDLASSQCQSNSLCKSSVNFALSVSKNCCPIITEEWLYFLMSTMKEALDNPNSLCQKHFLTMVLAPLKNTTTEPEVVEKIAVLLSLPFTLDESIHEISPGLISNLQTLYVETKVLPHLLYTCKLMVINRVKGLSLTLEDICSKLTMEDLEALEKLLRVVTYLIHIDNEYITQFCDGVLVLHACPVFQLCLKLDGIKPGLAADTVGILCHLLRTSPNNKSIVEEVLLGVKEQNKSEDSLNSRNELWRLISHKNPSIQSRSIRVFTYLCLNSERVKTEFFDKQKSNVWKVLRRASISSHAGVRETAEFSLQALNYKSNSNSNITVKSENSSTFNNSVGLNCTTAAMMVDDNIADSVTSITAGCDQLDINEKNNESLIVDISELQQEDDKHLTTEYTTSSLHDSGSASANDSSR